MLERVETYFHFLIVIGIEQKMVSVLRHRKKSPPRASSSQSHASTSCTSPSVNIPLAESFQSAPLVVPSNLELQIEPIQPNQSSRAAST